MRPLCRIDRGFASTVTLRAVVLWLVVGAATHAAPVAVETMRLRVYWGGGAPQAWSGQVSADGGDVSQLGRLATGPFVAAMHAEADGRVEIRRGGPTRHNALDVTLRIGQAKRLRIELTPGDGGPQVFELPVEQLLVTSYSATLNGDAGRLVVHRLAEDQLRIDTGREDALILKPGESLPLAIDAALVEAEPLSPVDLTVEVLRGRGGEVVSSKTERAEFPTAGPAHLATEVTLPTIEGVYSIRVAAVRPPGLTKVFLPRSSGKVLAERTIQVLVFDPQRYRKPSLPGSLLAEIDPTAPRWWERVPRWVWPRRLTRPEQHLGSSEPIVVGDETQAFVELPASTSAEGDDWHAYPLPVTAAGRPHVVEVEYPVDKQQTLTVTLLGRDALGDTAPIGASDEVFTSDWPTIEATDGPSPTRTIRRVFWPNDGAPLLLLSNHGNQPARFGKIRVYQLDEEETPPASTPAEGRTVALCLTMPRLADAVGASLAPAPDGSYQFDDWQTWSETATRLADLVELGGYNGAVVTVASSQGTVYPSKVLAAVPGADREPLAHNAVDVPQKDLLELLLREFDRRGLRLTPAVVFDAALPKLETERREVLATEDPVYDPLRPEVSNAMGEIVAELVSRCGDHASFGGVAVDVGGGEASGYGLLPAADHGQAIDQVERFLAASGLTWPERVPRDEETVRIALSGPWRSAWADWRRERMTDVYQSLTAIVRRHSAEHDVWLLTNNVATRPAGRRMLTPKLDLANPNDLYAASGIDLAVLKETPGLSVAVASEIYGGRSLAEEATARSTNRIRAEAHEQLGSRGAAMMARRPMLRRLATPRPNDRLTAPMPELLVIATPALAGAIDADSSALGSVAALLDGGAAVSQLIDAEAIDMRRRLAAGGAKPESNDGGPMPLVSQRPLLIRTNVSDTASTLELQNPLPWPVEAKVTVDVSEPCTGRWGDGRPDHFERGQHVLSKTIGAYEAATYRFDAAGVQVAGVRSTLPEVARQALADRLSDLKRRDLSVVSRYEAASNLSFEEQNAEGRLLNWSAITNGGVVRLNDRDPKEGAVALLLAHPGERPSPVVLQTQPMPAPATGQLAVTFHLRPEEVTRDTRFVVRIEEVGGDYSSSTTLDATRLGSEQLRLPNEEPPGGWRRPYAFAATDLPIGGDKPIRLVFELAGEGAISIDLIEMYDLVFPLDYFGDESARQKLALLKLIRTAESAFDRGDYGECFEILDGYWPRFLQAYTPLLPEAPPVAEVEEIPPAESSVEEEEPAEVSGGWRSYLPRFWR